MDNTADAAKLASLERKVATYEGVLFTIASMRTTDGDWVKWSDVEKLLALRTAEAAELEAWRSMKEENYYTDIAKAREATDAARRAANIKDNP